MLHYANTTVFNVSAQVIANTVNCVGVMGNGLALECRLRYPEMFADYAERCRQGEVRIGKPYLFRYSEEFGILNFPCKDHWKYPSRVEWIRRGLAGFRVLQPEWPITSIAFPPLGCDLGHLDWREIQPIMVDALGDLPYDVYICADRDEYASGVEGAMVAALNDAESPFWLSALDLPGRTLNALRTVLPVKRFRDLRKAAGIGKTIYERVHRYLYSMAIPECVRRQDFPPRVA